MSHFSEDYGYQAFRILQFTFIVAPILAGLDKFFNFLTHWSQYLSPFVLRMVHDQGHGFMMVAGVIEVIAGLGVLFKPKVFSWIVSLWLLGIIINLLLTGHYFDIALRDLGLFLAAVSLNRLSLKYAR